MEGRTDYSLGIGGWQGLKRVFHVKVNSVNDFPEIIMQVPALVDEGTAVPWGSTYPNDSSGLVVVQIDRLERLDHLNYKMGAVYGPPVVIETSSNIIDHWQWDIEGGLTFERIFFDRNRVPIASPRYEEIGRDEVGVPPEETFFTNHNNKTQRLLRKPNEFEPLQGADFPAKRATLIGFRKVARLTGTVPGSILNHLGRVNLRPFQGAEVAALRFTALSVHPVGGILTPFGGLVIRPDDLRHFEITIVFEWNPDIWEPFRQVHVRTWDDGSFSVIYDADNPEANLVESRHSLHEFSDYLVTILEPFE
jgi:hypothetical protein